MSIIIKRQELLEELDRIQNKETLSKSDRRKSNIILRRLCEKEVSIDTEEEDYDDLEIRG
jgi:hypothetical protein